MKHSQIYKARNSGFTLIELVSVIVLLGVLGVVAAPRFLSFVNDARRASNLTLFEHFRSGIELYQAACMARGGDTSEPQGQNLSDFEIDGMRSNFSGSCYPTTTNRRDIPRPNVCYQTFQTMVNSDHFEDVAYGSANSSRGGQNRETLSLSDFETARDAGYQVFIHQRLRYFSYCHYYNIEGDLSEAPFVLYNAVDGRIITGVADLTQNFTWTDELSKYGQYSTPPFR